MNYLQTPPLSKENESSLVKHARKCIILPVRHFPKIHRQQGLQAENTQDLAVMT